MLPGEVARELVIGAVGEHELHLVAPGKCVQVLTAKSIRRARVRTLHVHDLVDLFRHTGEQALATGLQQHGIAAVHESLHQRHQFALLQHRLAAGDLDKPHRRKPLHFRQNLICRHFATAGKGVLRITPRAAQVTAGKPHKDARQAGE